MITDFHGCETEGSSFYRARICCVFGCIGKGIGHEDIQKDFLSFCSRSHAKKKGDWLSRILEWTISKIQLRGNFSDESMYKRDKLYK